MATRRAFRIFLREYIDDIVRLAALAAILGAILPLHRQGVGFIISSALIFVGLLIFLLFFSIMFAVGEYYSEGDDGGQPNTGIFISIILLNFLAMFCVLWVVFGLVLRAVTGALG